MILKVIHNNSTFKMKAVRARNYQANINPTINNNNKKHNNNK